MCGTGLLEIFPFIKDLNDHLGKDIQISNLNAIIAPKFTIVTTFNTSMRPVTLNSGTGVTFVQKIPIPTAQGKT